MTPAGPPSDQLLSAWHRRFPGRDVWPARVRLWRVELPVRPPSPVAEWIRRAAADAGGPEGAARRLGLPLGAVRGAPVRRTFAFIDLPTGPHPVPVPPVTFGPWPEPVGEVPPAVLRPPGVDVIPMSEDWRTVPVVRAELVDVVMVRGGDRIDVYVADDPDGSPLGLLPAAAWPGPG